MLKMNTYRVDCAKLRTFWTRVACWASKKHVTCVHIQWMCCQHSDNKLL